MKKIITFAIFLLSITSIAFLSWCSDKTNIVEIWDTVEINYTATLQNWDIFKTNEEWDALRFIVGEEDVILWLDKWVIGKKINKSYTLKISPEDAYGSEYNEMNVQKISKKVFDTAKLEVKKWETIEFWELKWIVKNIEKDDKWNDMVFLEMNEKYTYEILNYSFTIVKLEKKVEEITEAVETTEDVTEESFTE